MSVLCGLATCVFTFKLRLHLSGPFDLIKKNSQTCVIIVSLVLSCEGCLWLEASQGNFFPHRKVQNQGQTMACNVIYLAVKG